MFATVLSERMTLCFSALAVSAPCVRYAPYGMYGVMAVPTPPKAASLRKTLRPVLRLPPPGLAVRGSGVCGFPSLVPDFSEGCSSLDGIA